MQIQLGLYKTFCPTPPPLTHKQLKHSQKTKINQIMLSASPSSFFMLSSHVNGNANKHSIQTINEFGPPVLESSTKISKFHAPTDSEPKFHKERIENWLPIEFELGSP